MKPISNNFINALKQIKQIDAIISYADHENTNYIVTQNSEILLTEAQDYLVTESSEVVIDNGGIQNCSIYWNTDIFKSVCKMLDLETSNRIAKGTEINVRFGLLVGNSYEYIDYGKFYTTQDSEYSIPTGTYTTTAYDKMVSFNISAKENPLTFEEGVKYSLKQYLEMICNKCGVLYSFDFTNLANANKNIIEGNPYGTDKEVTYRDIIDDIAECLGTNFIINSDNRITNKEIQTSSVITIDGDILKDTNVYIGEKKNAIDGLQIYDGSTLINYVGDDNSIFKIKSNNIMSAHSQDLMENVLDMIEGFEYYAYQLETFGIFALEPFDCFTVEYNNTNYLLCSFHNDLKITSGVSEEISYIFKDEDSTYEYTTSNSIDKTRDAFIEIDKAKGEVVLKATADGRLVEARLDADADDGSEFSVKADNIKLEGYTTINNGFGVDLNGNMFANGGTFGGTISTSADCTVGNNLYVGQNQSPTDLQGKGIYFNSGSYIKRTVAGGGNIDILSMNSPVAVSINTNGNPMINTNDGYVNLYGITRIQLNDENIASFYSNQIQFAFQPIITSDKRLKDKIKNIDVSWIDDLKVKEFEYKNNKGKKEIGLIAQEYVDKEYSNYFLSKNKEGYYAIEYGNITNALIQYCQELKQEVEELKQEVKELKNEK